DDGGLAEAAREGGGDRSLAARGDGGTPLVAALFWGHREVVDLLGVEPRNLRVAAGLGRVDEIDALAGTPEAAAHRAFYRPHGGGPGGAAPARPHGGGQRGPRWGGDGRRGRGGHRPADAGGGAHVHPRR